MLERTFSRKQLLAFQEEYAVKLMIPGSSREEPGLMVIKTSLKTKARQRKGAISNWKVGMLRFHIHTRLFRITIK